MATICAACRLSERKSLLKEILTPNDVIRYSEHFVGDGADLLAAAKQQGIEGIVGKRASSFYESRRRRDWMKYKVINSDSFVLCGFTKGERDCFGALVLGIYDRAKLTWAGNVGTGFDRKMMQAIHDRSSRRWRLRNVRWSRTRTCPRRDAVTWTRPELVCEVRFTNWTDDGRLRAPVFAGCVRTSIRRNACANPERADAG